MILPIPQGGLFGAINEDRKVRIGDISLRKYMSKHTKLMININSITSGFKTSIRAMLV